MIITNIAVTASTGAESLSIAAAIEPGDDVREAVGALRDYAWDALAAIAVRAFEGSASPPPRILPEITDLSYAAADTKGGRVLLQADLEPGDDRQACFLELRKQARSLLNAA